MLSLRNLNENTIPMENSTGGVQKFVGFRHKGYWGINSKKEKPDPV